MSDPEIFVNESSGETLTLDDFLAEQRRIERDMTRLDVAIETHKEALKAAKDGKEKAVRDLRATIREIKLRTRGAKKAARRRSAGKPTVS